MRVAAVILLVLGLASSANAQSNNSVAPDTTTESRNTFVKPDVEAKFPGGMNKMMKFLKNNLVYPAEATQNKIQGNVYVKFVVEKDGSITHIEVMKPKHPALDQEAVRLVSIFPAWIPATLDDQPIRSQFVLPVYFKIEN